MGSIRRCVNSLKMDGIRKSQKPQSLLSRLISGAILNEKKSQRKRRKLPKTLIFADIRSAKQKGEGIFTASRTQVRLFVCLV